MKQEKLHFRREYIKRCLYAILVVLFAFTLTAVAVFNERGFYTSTIYSEGWPDGQEEGFIPVEGGRVFYHYYGKDKTEIPIIFLHGGPGGTGECFFRQVELASEHPVVIYNQLGTYGSDFSEDIKTPEEAEKYLTIEHYVDELQTVVDYFGFDEYMLVGHSWGTMLAVEYAAAKHPEGLKGLALAGPFLNVDVWCQDARRLIQSLPEKDVCGQMMDGKEMWDVIKECEENGLYYDDERYCVINDIYTDYFNTRFENEGCYDEMPYDHGASQYEIPDLDVYTYMWGPSEFTCNGTLKGHDSTHLLDEITIPVLYISGQYDSGTFEAAIKYNEMTPNGELCVLPSCAHVSLAERPAEFNAVISAFADRITK